MSPPITLVLLPGMDGTGLLFSDFISALTGEAKTITVSYSADQPYDYSELETVARSFLPKNQPFVLLGESFSGPIAISIAASCPPGLVGLILCSSFARNPFPALSGLRSLLGLLPIKFMPVSFIKFMLMGRYSSAALRLKLGQALALLSAEVMQARIGAVLSVDVTSKLPYIRTPVLYLRALEDFVIPRAASELIASSLAIHRIADFKSPHCLLQVMPSAAATVILEFLREVAESLTTHSSPSRPDDLGV